MNFMIKKSVFLARLILLVSSLFAGETYQSIRVFRPSFQTIETIAKAGIPLDHVTGKKDIYLDIIVTEDETIELLSLGLDVEILVSDMTKYYLSKNIPAPVRDFPLGSMQGNYTLDELNARFDELQDAYSNIISERVIIGQSIEGRDIWAFKVSDNPEEDDGQKRIQKIMRSCPEHRLDS